MKIQSSLKLGRTTDLIAGYDANWLSGTPVNDGLFAPTAKPLNVFELELKPGTTAAWGFPEISLHDSAESLLDALFPFETFDPQDGDPTAVMPAGALLLGDNRAEALKKLSGTLGVDLSKTDGGFALVVLRREAGVAEHGVVDQGIIISPHPVTPDPALGIDEKFRQELARLRHGSKADQSFSPDNLGVADAQAYLDIFATYGTHFISRITLGDLLFQVFSMAADPFEKVKAVYAGNKHPLKGEGAEAFAMFTTDGRTGAFGKVREYGRIVSLSGDPALATALKNKAWYEPVWAQTDSIFAPFEAGAAITADILNRDYTAVVPIRTQLTNLGIFAEYNRCRLWQRIFQGAAIQKYSAAVKPRLKAYCDWTIEDSFPESEFGGFVSTLSTPVINVYKPSIDLGKMQLVSAEEVREFTLMTHLLDLDSTQPAQIPGAQVTILAQYANFEKEKSTPVLTLTDAAYDAAALSIRHFYGILQVNNRSGSKHYTVLDGLQYVSVKNGPQGRQTVKIGADLRTPAAETVLPRVKNNLEFVFSFAESIINGSRLAPNDPMQEFVRDALLWLAALLPKTTSDAGLLDLRLRTLDLANLIADPDAGAFVPILPYASYEKQVRNMLDYISEINNQILQYQSELETRRTQELIVNVGKTLNENIVESGQLLSKMIEANARQQAQMNDYYQSILDQKKLELGRQNDETGVLEKMLNDQRIAVETTVANYKQAVKDWQTMEYIKVAFTIASGLFDVGAAFAEPTKAVEALGKLGDLAGKIKKLAAVLAKVGAVYTAAKPKFDEIKEAQSAVDKLDESDFGIYSKLSWDELNENMKEVMDLGPSGDMVDPAKKAFLSAFKILVERGKALLDAQKQSHQLARDIYLQQKQQDINAQQAQRLDVLKTAFHPKDIAKLDLSKIDLIGLTGSLVFLRSQMTSMLSKAFTLQDQALQYQFLQAPTITTDFSLIGFKRALALQSNSTTAAQTKLYVIQKTTTTPIVITIPGVPVDSLTNGNQFAFQIYLDNPHFTRYVDARVKSAVASVKGVKSTESADNHYLLNLSFQGNPFFDRDGDLNKKTFRTPRRSRTYEYEAGTGAPKFSDEGASWSQDVNPVTPFGAWEISLPKTETNRGIRFDGPTVDLEISFVLEARIKEKPQTKGLMARGAVLPSAPELVGAMFNQGSALNGWDVVFNMTLEQINASLADQYAELKDKPGFGSTIKVETRTEIRKGKLWAIKKFDLQFGLPKLYFLENNPQSAQLDIPILKGTVTDCSQMGTDPMECDDPVEIKGELMTAIVPLSKVQGLVAGAGANVYSVALDLAQGSFEAKNIQMSDEERIDFNKALIAYFVNNPIRFIVNSLDLSGISTLADLRPNQFSFKTLITGSGAKILQIFIETNTRSALNYSQTFLNNLPEPIPQGYQCSLMVSSKIFFNSLLTASMNRQGWTLAGKDPNAGNKAWWAEFTGGSVSGTVDLSRLHNRSTSGGMYGGGTSTTDISYSLPNGRASFQVSGMRLDPRSDGKIDLKFSKQQTQTLTRRVETSYSPNFFGVPPDVSETSHNIGATLTITAQLPIAIQGAGRDQQVKINVGNKSVGISGRTSGGGPCGCDDLEAQFNTELINQVPPQVTNQVNVSFDPVSVFALKNLLFPSKNYIQLQEAFAPGDLLILGSFGKTS